MTPEQKQQLEKEKNLVAGVRLAILHPKVANRSCESCQKWLYNEDTGRIEHRNGKPVQRIEAAVPPCRTRIGCPKGTPENSRELLPENKIAYRQYQEFKATGRFPADPDIAKNARLIRLAEDQIERERSDKLQATLQEIADGLYRLRRT